MLGMSAATADDLSPLDIAKLVRYARMNVPSLAPALTELLRMEGLDLSVKPLSSKAA
jgi:hypothetical protein